MELNDNEFQILMKFFKKNNEIAKNNNYSPEILVFDDYVYDNRWEDYRYAYHKNLVEKADD